VSKDKVSQCKFKILLINASVFLTIFNYIYFTVVRPVARVEPLLRLRVRLPRARYPDARRRRAEDELEGAVAARK
jgi:hypothetical protein